MEDCALGVALRGHCVGSCGESDGEGDAPELPDSEDDVEGAAPTVSEADGVHVRLPGVVVMLPEAPCVGQLASLGVPAGVLAAVPATEAVMLEAALGVTLLEAPCVSEPVSLVVPAGVLVEEVPVPGPDAPGDAESDDGADAGGDVGVADTRAETTGDADADSEASQGALPWKSRRPCCGVSERSQLAPAPPNRSRPAFMRLEGTSCVMLYTSAHGCPAAVAAARRAPNE